MSVIFIGKTLLACILLYFGQMATIVKIVAEPILYLTGSIIQTSVPLLMPAVNDAIRLGMVKETVKESTEWVNNEGGNSWAIVILSSVVLIYALNLILRIVNTLVQLTTH